VTNIGRRYRGTRACHAPWLHHLTKGKKVHVEPLQMAVRGAPSDLRKWHAQSQMLLVSASLMQSPLMFIQLQG